MNPEYRNSRFEPTNNISHNETLSQLENQQHRSQNDFLHNIAVNRIRNEENNNGINDYGPGFIRPSDIISAESQPKEYKSRIKNTEAIEALLKQFDKMFPINKMTYKEIAYDKCKNCSKKHVNIENNDLLFNLKDDIVLCQNCLEQGQFSDETTFSDFKPISEIKNKLKTTDLEILSAVYKNGDNWTAIAKELDTPEEECVIRFLKIDLTEKWTLDVPVFENSANRILAVVSFLCTCVEPKVASEFAKEILINYDNGHSEEDLITRGLSEAKKCAKQVLFLEHQKFERVCEVLLHAQTQKLELKELTLKDLNNHFTFQKTELVKYRDIYRTELEEMRKEKN